jgi:hypothetical protein
VWGWQQKRLPGADGKKKGPRLLIDDLAAFDWTGRDVYIVFDSDAVGNRNILLAEWRLAKLLNAKGARVRIVRLAPGENGAKVGLDDFLVAQGRHALDGLLQTAIQPVAPDDRVKVVLHTAEYEVIAEVMSALAKFDSTLFKRGGQLVQMVKDTRPGHEGTGTKDSLQIAPDAS